MDTQIVAIYCLCDDILKGLKHCEDKQRQMSDAEVMTTSIVAVFQWQYGKVADLFARAWLYSEDVGEKSVQSSPTQDCGVVSSGF